MTNPPPSLRVYTLAKQLPGLFSGTDLLDADGQLLVELELYAAEENRANAERMARDQARERRAQGPGGVMSRARRRHG